MFYYKIIGYGSCPWCQRANSLLLQEKLPFVASWIENSWALVGLETGDEHVIGGYTDLKEHIDKGLHQESNKETE
jgi:glutaredoxin